ncbi:uncharacterized protein V1510DRAFT_396914, partial [Dipodascopsis tothii]|uniref:uncharacterized protein n=1 Tax=Dipodascopsis tothii TaxID=44089 RepID=UPI0034CE84B5
MAAAMGAMASGMANGAPAAAAPGTPSALHRSEQEFLNAYIYDYLLKHNLHESAKAFSQETDVKVHPISKGPDGSAADAFKNEARRRQGEAAKDGPDDENTLSRSVGIIDAPEGFLFEWWLIFWDLLFARSNKPASAPAQQFMQAQQRLRQEQAARASQLQQHGGLVGQQGQMLSPVVYPQNAATAALLNARLQNGHMPDGVQSDLEKQRQQLARQAALNRRSLTTAQQMHFKQQQQMYAQQQHLQQSQQAAAQDPNSLQPRPSAHSPPPSQGGSPSKRPRLSPDGGYAQIQAARTPGGTQFTQAQAAQAQ